MCKNYGWDLEYVLGLTRGQINVLTDGMQEVAEVKAEATDEVRTGKGKGRWVTYNKRGEKVQHDVQSANDIFQLASIPGFSLTDRAKKALKKIAQDRLKKAEKDASKSG